MAPKDLNELAELTNQFAKLTHQLLRGYRPAEPLQSLGKKR